MIRIVLHHTCKSSYTLYKALKGVGGIKFEMASTPYFTYLKDYVFSVPAVFYGNELILLDPVEPDDVMTLKEGKNKRELAIDEAIENFARGIMASQAILTTVMLHKSLKPALDPHLVSILSRAKYHSQEEKLPQIVETIVRQEGKILTEHWETFVKLLTYGFIRELMWLEVEIDEVDKSHIKTWLLAKATVGRLGLPHPRPTVPQDVVEAVYTTLKEAGGRYLGRLKEEQQILQNDAEFLSLY
ncbi:MAG: thioredoxin [Pyrobaculum sp.]